MSEQTSVDERRYVQLQKLIEEGLAQLDRGEGIPGDQVLQRLREKSRKRSQPSSSPAGALAGTRSA